MGLDTSFELRVKNQELFGDFPSWIRFEPWEKEHNYPPSILYWRKCWNIRSFIEECLCQENYTSEQIDGTVTNISLEAFKKVAEGLKKCYTKKWWKEHNDSIWDWDEIGESYKDNLKYAQEVIKFLETKDPSSYEIEYVDSY